MPGHWYRTVVGLVLWMSAVRLWLDLRLHAKRDPPIPVAILCGAGIGLLAGLTGTGGGLYTFRLVESDWRYGVGTLALFGIAIVGAFMRRFILICSRCERRI